LVVGSVALVGQARALLQPSSGELS
jgi:hypothetical protein